MNADLISKILTPGNRPLVKRKFLSDDKLDEIINSPISSNDMMKNVDLPMEHPFSDDDKIVTPDNYLTIRPSALSSSWSKGQRYLALTPQETEDERR